MDAYNMGVYYIVCFQYKILHTHEQSVNAVANKLCFS